MRTKMILLLMLTVFYLKASAQNETTPIKGSATQGWNTTPYRPDELRRLTGAALMGVGIPRWINGGKKLRQHSSHLQWHIGSHSAVVSTDFSCSSI